MKNAVVFLCIIVVIGGEESDAPPRKRQVYLINTPNLDWNKPESSNNVVCQDDDSSISVNYFASRLKSLKNTKQRLLFETIVGTCFYRALLGVLTSNSTLPSYNIPEGSSNPQSSHTIPAPSPQLQKPQPASSPAFSSLFNQLYSHGQNPYSYLNQREIYLINAGNLKVNEAKSSSNLECKTDETLVYANYIVTRLKSIDDRRQRLLCEQLIVSALHKTLLQSQITGTNVNTTANAKSPQQQPQPQSQSPPENRATVESTPETSIRTQPQYVQPETTVSTTLSNQSPSQPPIRKQSRPLLSSGGGSVSYAVGAGAPGGGAPLSTTPLSTTPLETAPARSNEDPSSMALVTADIPADERQKLQEIHAECQADSLSQVDEALIRALDANKDNRQLQIHMYCIGVKTGMIRPDGILNERIIKRKIGFLIEGDEAVNEVYRKCNVQKNSKEATMTYFWICLMSEGTEYYPKV